MTPDGQSTAPRRRLGSVGLRPDCFIPVFLLLAVIGAAPLQAQTAADTVRAVEIVRRSVFDPDEANFFLLKLVNSLHITTREYVVRQELLFGAGEPWDSARVAESARNLRRLGVFRAVSIDSVRTDSGLIARVKTRDGWSTRPDFRFKSTGGQLDYTLALIEDNLLGTASSASLRYHSNPDRTTTVLGFSQPRLVAGVVGLNARWDNRSDGDRLGFAVTRPFFRVETPQAWQIRAEQRDERILRFAEGLEDPVDSVFRDHHFVSLSFGRAIHASPAGYLRWSVAAQLQDENLLAGPPGVHPVSGPRTSGAVGGWLEWRRVRYATITGYNSQSRAEDVDLSDLVSVGAWLAPESFGYRRGGIGPTLVLQSGRRFGNGFARAQLSAHGLITSAGVDSGSVRLQGTVALIPNPQQLLVLYGTAGMIRNPLPGSEYDLGLGAGPRGFAQHAFTGDRMFFGTAEFRQGLVNDLLKVVDVGVAAFVDYGGAWYLGSRQRTGWDAGIGLRLGTSRAPGLETNRLDLVYRGGNDRESAGWLFVVAKGFSFASGLRGGQ